MMDRRKLLATAAAVPLAIASAVPALARKPEIYSTGGAAIGGYDPVAYFTDSEPVMGREEHSLEWKGAEWRFANAENLEAFRADPEAYAPQYGGYCAYAVSKNYTASISPNAWTIHDGKLYLNYNRIVRGLWSTNIPGRVSSADANWPGVLDG